jgi:hypothetical protein
LRMTFHSWIWLIRIILLRMQGIEKALKWWINLCFMDKIIKPINKKAILKIKTLIIILSNYWSKR